ncbi:MAG: nucleotidyl transferase AbiEii/AbiGii toxin family protein [Pelodictyon phaeoclathratiforme]
MPINQVLPTKTAIERAAGILVTTDEAFIEKDWHVVRALTLLNGLHIQGLQLAFGGGTSLAKAGLIKRFSEDVDFKATITPAGHKYYRETRKKIIAALEDGGLVLVAEPMVRDGSRFFSLELDYGATFMRNQRLRTHIRVEVRFVAPQMPVVFKPVQSLLRFTEGQPAEIGSMPYIDPVEIAADKLSALSWRLLDEEERQDKTLIRHVHDLAALETLIASNVKFPDLVRQSIAGDYNRSDIPQEQRLRGVMTNLQNAVWKEAYQSFVQDMSFSRDDEIIPYESALDACERLVYLVDR